MASEISRIRSRFVGLARNGKYGVMRTVGISRLIGAATYKLRHPALALANLPVKDYEKAVRDTEYFRVQSDRHGADTAARKSRQFRLTLRSIRNEYIRDRQHAAVVVMDGDRLIDRLDGTHRLSALRFLGYKAVPVLVVEPSDYAAFMARHATEQFPKWYQPIELVPGVWTGKWSDHKQGAVLEMLPDVKGKAVLDIGCNSGLYSLECAKRGAKVVYGVDKRAEAIRQAEYVRVVWGASDRRCHKAHFTHANILRSLGAIKRAEIVVACCVLYHLTDGLHSVMKAIRDSSVHTILVQGNRNRAKKFDKDKLAEIHAQPIELQTEKAVFDLPQFGQLMSKYGFMQWSSKPGVFPVAVYVR